MLRLAAAAHPLRAGPTALARLSGLRFCSSDARKNEVAEAIDDKSTFETFTGAPEGMLNERVVRIFKQSQQVVSGTQNTLAWRLQWEDNATKRWANPLMGWSSTRDPLSNTHMTMEFETPEDAIRFCEQNGAGHADRTRMHTATLVPRATPPPPPPPPDGVHAPSFRLLLRMRSHMALLFCPCAVPRRLEVRGGTTQAVQGHARHPQEVLRQLHLAGSQRSRLSRPLCSAAAASAAQVLIRPDAQPRVREVAVLAGQAGL